MEFYSYSIAFTDKHRASQIIIKATVWMNFDIVFFNDEKKSLLSYILADSLFYLNQQVLVAQW